MGKDYYAVLGLPQNATDQQVRARFLELARKRHPDRFQGAEKEQAETDFQEITQAFNLLSDPQRRRQIDAELARSDSPPAAIVNQAAKVYIQRGVKAYRQKNYLQAAENFDRATREDPDNARAWHYLAQACQHHRRWWPQGRSAIIRACELEPMNVAYLKLAGKLFAQSGMMSRAEKYFGQALDWGGEDAEIRKALEEIKGSRKSKGGLFGRGG